MNNINYKIAYLKFKMQNEHFKPLPKPKIGVNLAFPFLQEQIPWFNLPIDFTNLFNELEKTRAEGGLLMSKLTDSMFNKFCYYCMSNCTNKNYTLANWKTLYDSMDLERKRFCSGGYLLDILYDSKLEELRLITHSYYGSPDIYSYEPIKTLFASSLVKYLLK
jgi:hypothetical protein